MAISIQMAGNGFGGIVQGNFGTYQAASDGTFTVDTRDAPTMLALGMTYVKKASRSYSTVNAPLVATSGKIAASAALSNGALAIANQPDVIRPAQVIMGAGTVAVTAGQVAITYVANDGLSRTDTISAIMVASGGITQNLSAAVARVSTMVISNMAGGASPFIHIDTTATLGMPVDPGVVDFAVTKETIDTGDETIGTLLAGVIGSITPTTAPNGTHTYSFAYYFISPEQ